MHSAVLAMLGLVFVPSLGLPISHARFQRDAEHEDSEFLRRYHYFTSDGSMSEAVREFQRFVHTSLSGNVDGETREWMAKARCGMPDSTDNAATKRRKRFALQGSKWNKTQLTYKIINYSGDLPTYIEDRVFAEAFEVWSAISPLSFTKVNNQDRADISILFAVGYHGDKQAFDGPGKILAHAYFPDGGGHQHYDRDEQWTDKEAWGTNLKQTATHEIGHSLGLGHTNVRSAVMFPYISAYDPYFRLDPDDIFAMRTLYGEICSYNKPCSNGGTCVYENYVSTCNCPSDYTGKTCQIYLNPCASHPCGNGGSCINSATTYRCICPSGFTGNQCAIRLTYCDERPCQHGGFCEDLSNDYFCRCPTAYSGKNCEIYEWHVCSVQPCYNGATCKPTAETNGFKCECREGFSGVYCEQRIQLADPTTPETTYKTLAPPTVYVPFNPYDFCNIPPIDATTTTNDGTTYFFKGNLAYGVVGLNSVVKTGYPKYISEEFPYTQGKVNAALQWQQTGETWLFMEDGSISIHYNRYHLRNLHLTNTFPGVPIDLDAAFYWPYDGSAYLIKGTQFWQVNLWNRVIQRARGDLREWGISTSVDSALVHNGLLYFFTGYQYYKIDPPTRQIVEGYPKIITKDWFNCH